MLGILLIVIAGLAITKPLATGDFVVSQVEVPLTFTDLSLLVYSILQWLWIRKQRICLSAGHLAIPIYPFWL